MNFQTYRAAVARSFSALDVLRIEHLPVRPLAPGSIRVAVRVGGVNPVDAAIRSSSFGGSTPFVLGTEFAGVVTKGVSVGDHVVGFGTPASDADLVDTSPDRVVTKPDDLAWDLAGASARSGSPHRTLQPRPPTTTTASSTTNASDP
ncbi:alcohol dehydrogenase catalytic domain-containing protein [Streptomyces sp. NPDC127038]|uniref:alcohol dehydrogenase catalytic domain-containing protein n=1 Tax=Streptomyces sp. NPDC127038 TaxID=3347114 RepID=UPI003667ED8E